MQLTSPSQQLQIAVLIHFLLTKKKGAVVKKNEHVEIGWFPISFTEEGKKSQLLKVLEEGFYLKK